MGLGFFPYLIEFFFPSLFYILRRMGENKTFQRIFIHTSYVDRIRNPAGFLACPSVPAIAIARAVPTGGPRYTSAGGSRRCIRMCEYVDRLDFSLVPIF